MSFDFHDPFDVMLQISRRRRGLRRSGGALVGRIRGFDLRLRFMRPAIGRMDGHIAGLSGSITGPDIAPRVMIRTGGGGAPIGDPELDRRFRVRGEPPMLAACLSAPARRALLTLDGEETDVSVDEGSITIEDRACRSHDRARVESVIDCLVVAAEQLAVDPEDVAHRLFESALHDPEDGFRRSAVRALLDVFPGSDWARRAKEALSRPEAPLVLRIEVATRSGVAGARTLAAAVADPGVPSALKIRAIAGLVSFASETPETDRAGLDLDRVIAGELGAEDEPLSIAAADALAKVGTLLAVEPLLARAEALFVDRDISRAARQAVAAIRERYSGGGAGQLSLASSKESTGELSLAKPGAEGELSLASPAAPSKESQ